MKNKILIGLGAFILLSFVIGAIAGDDEEAAEGENNATNEEVEEVNENEENNNDMNEEEEAEQSLEAYLEETIEDISGLETYRDDHPDTIVDIHTNDSSVELVLMTANHANPELWIEDSERVSEEYFETIFAERDDVDELELWFQAPDDGEVKDVLMIYMTRDTAEEIDWDNFHRTTFPDKADEYWSAL